MTLYANDPDANVTYPITDALGADLTFSPVVRIRGNGGPPDVTASWIGEVGPTRNLRVPAGLRSGSTYTLRLIVPGDNDIALGTITLA